MIDDFHRLMIIGVARDKVMAVHYYRLAADQGYAPAQVMIFLMRMMMMMMIMMMSMMMMMMMMMLIIVIPLIA